MDLAIIDYKMSNLHSVYEACKKVGISCQITSDPKKVLSAKIAILPGVGAFGEAMRQLQNTGLDDAILKFYDSGRPLIGICLGLQLLFESSQEFQKCQGLGIIKGEVTRFKKTNIGSIKYPVPQVGWNKIFDISNNWEDSLLRNNSSGDFMYFVHSFFAKPDQKNIICSESKYGNQIFCSSLSYKNIFATQFHPEKSGPDGLKLYQEIKKEYL